MPVASGVSKESVVPVDRGLYILRYASGGDVPPTASVRPTQGSQIGLISVPGAVESQLSGPGACLVVKAERPGELQITVRRRGDAGSMDARFRLEPIGSLDEPEDVRATLSEASSRVPEAGPSSLVSPESSFGLLCHIARRGDVEVGSSIWAAGPQSPGSIEGIEVRGANLSGLRVELQVLAGTTPPRWSDWVPQGVFAGSRGRAIRLLGLRMRLAGPMATQFVLVGDALFLGSSIVTKRGRAIEFVSAAGIDPLVGFRFCVAQERGLETNGFGLSEKRAGDARVRVFRASAHVD